jgi:NtrC-family two-component system sensor histidine kinase KinB
MRLIYGGHMTLKSKLMIGLGFLFLIIFTLEGFCSYYVGRLGQESENILTANYNSIVYSRNMLSGLDDMKTSMPFEIPNSDRAGTMSDYYLRLFETGRSEFETSLMAENNNITEIHEKEYVERLNNEYDSFKKLCLQMKNGSAGNSLYLNDFLPACQRLKESINSIYNVNMQAVVRKSQLAKADSLKFINYMGFIGIICLLITFAYLWYFPFYISTSLSYLSDRMIKLLKDSGMTMDIKTNDEDAIILQGINLLSNKLGITLEEESSENDRPEVIG